MIGGEELGLRVLASLASAMASSYSHLYYSRYIGAYLLQIHQ